MQCTWFQLELAFQLEPSFLMPKKTIDVNRLLFLPRTLPPSDARAGGPTSAPRTLTHAHKDCVYPQSLQIGPESSRYLAHLRTAERHP